MPITIQEIIASDTISQFVDKTNFNFDQLLLNGGGPSGPTGPKGPTGPAGGRGPKGSTWYDDAATSNPGNTPNAVPPTATPLSGDYYLQFNGQVWEYNGTTWVITTVDLQGPAGPKGSGGGFSESTGAPIFNESNILYNGPIGLNDGANATNEGVPSIMIGGVTSQTPQLTGIPFTAAYIVPQAIVVGNPSTLTSLLIHQRDSNSRGIVFHGGDTGIFDKYEQTLPALLSNISIGIDDKLMLNVPKNPTSPLSQTQMRGIELISESRSQYFRAGADILFQSGVGPSGPLFAGQHSNFEINVGSGGSNGDGNVFKTITTGTISKTLLEAGNSTQISLVTNQATQTGNWQVQAGAISMISSTSKDMNLYSGNNLRLNTLAAGGANAGTGAIVLTSGIGGIGIQTAGLINITTAGAGAGSININSGDEVLINADSEILMDAQTSISIVAGQSGSGDIDMSANGNITIQQLRTTGASGNNVIIRNTMTSTAGSSFLGQVSIESQNQIKLGAWLPSFSASPKINLQFAPTAGDTRVTQFVGSQTWISTGNGLNLLLTEPTNQYNDLTGVTNTEGVFRKVVAGPTGSKTTPTIRPGFRYEAWQARQNIAGSSPSTLPSVTGQAAVIVLGNESIATAPYDFLSSFSLEDRTMTFSTRTEGDSLNPAFENFSANMDKTAVASAFVWKRSSVHNSLGNKQPLQEIGATTYTGNGQDNNTNFPAYSNQTLVGPQYGWDYRNSTSPPTAAVGMPTTAQLQPFIVLSFGNGVGKRATVSSAPVTTSVSPPNVNASFNFPPGAYPGQQVTVMFDNYSLQAGFTEGSPAVSFEALWYGSIRLNIPLMRTAATVAGLATESWYDTNDGVAIGNSGGNNGKRNFYEILNDTTPTDATFNITKSIAITLIWDGGVQRTWSADSDVVGEDNIKGYTQYGWRIIGIPQSVKASRRVNPPQTT